MSDKSDPVLDYMKGRVLGASGIFASDNLPATMLGASHRAAEEKRKDGEDAGTGAGYGIALILAILVAPFLMLAHSPIFAAIFTVVQRLLSYVLSLLDNSILETPRATHGGFFNVYMDYMYAIGSGCQLHPIQNGADWAAYMFDVASCDSVSFTWGGLLLGSVAAIVLCAIYCRRVEARLGTNPVYWWLRHLWRVAASSVLAVMVLQYLGDDPAWMIGLTAAVFAASNLFYFHRRKSGDFS